MAPTGLAQLKPANGAHPTATVRNAVSSNDSVLSRKTYLFIGAAGQQTAQVAAWAFELW